MVHDSHVKHHQHVRHRIHNNLEKYPHPDNVKNLIDKLVYIGGFVGLAMTIPQILKIWVEKNAAGISVISWATYMVTGSIMVAYGYVHKEKPIMLTYLCWEVFYILIIVGALMYG